MMIPASFHHTSSMAVVMFPRRTCSVSLSFLLLSLLLQGSAVLVSSLQPPQNIETVYTGNRFTHPAQPTLPPPLPSPPPPPPSQQFPTTSPLPLPSPSSSRSTVIVKAVVATAACSAALAGLLIFLFRRRRVLARRKEKSVQGSPQLVRFASLQMSEFTRVNGIIKGLIVDENGLDVLYWRKLTRSGRSHFPSSRASSVNNYGRNSSIRKVFDSCLSQSRQPPYTNLKSEGSTASMSYSSSSSFSGSELKREEPEETRQEVALLDGHPGGSHRSSSSIDPIDEEYEHPSSPPPPSQWLPVEGPRPVSASSAVGSQTDMEVYLPLPLPPARRGIGRQEPRLPLPPAPPAEAFSLAGEAPPPPIKAVDLVKPPPIKAVDLVKPPPIKAVDLVKPSPSMAEGLTKPPPPPPPPPVNAVDLAKPPPPPPPPMTPKAGGSIGLPRPPSLPPKASGSNKQSPSKPPPPPSPPRASGPTKPPPPPPVRPGKAVRRDGKGGESSAVDGPKMRPLHWEKVEVNGDHSMVWDKMESGSFRVDGDLMEALFGSVATNRKPPQEFGNPSKPASNSKPETSSGKIFILEPRKSQNIAIILKSLGVSQREIIEALIEGHGLSAETLEKLDRITLTTDEQSKISRFQGDPSKLADAESFLYKILRAFPSAFSYFSAMQFKLNYDLEIDYLSKSLETLKLACEELRGRGVFVKLLEAILKAGNRMNAGTARGNATAFNLSSLRKLSDVKSTDGKTTLLHFVVEQVIRSEGKRCFLNRNQRMGRTFSRQSSSSSFAASLNSEEREKEYMMLGLPVVGCLSVEFSNVKKAAGIEYSTFTASMSGLRNRLSGIRKLVFDGANDGARFQREMKEFLQVAEEEIDTVQKAHAHVMELVKKTTEYYQAGRAKDNGADPLQIFVIVKDFLSMVDQVSEEIARNMQSKRGGSKPGSSSEKSPAKFPTILSQPVLQKSSGSRSSDESDDGF
ncbi:hypothetical protein SAY87_013130 [Trapa incisa]|uniref:Formin-like protein n=1 Tax=Trapa incisa TaxID=236973 RepID=A0AAN7KCL5_9MYRT|nr:hypothetical protein SAY87_013130 [Trapa incisa]